VVSEISASQFFRESSIRLCKRSQGGGGGVNPLIHEGGSQVLDSVYDPVECSGCVLDQTRQLLRWTIGWIQNGYLRRWPRVASVESQT